MKLISLIILLLSSYIRTQTGSVELRTGGGTLVNTFASIQSAYDAIPTPMNQSYIIEILPAYNQSSEVIPITLVAKTGASSTNTITIRPAAGNNNEVISATSTNNIIILNGANYVIIDGRPGGVGSIMGLKIENLATTGTSSNTILLQNGASYNVIRYVHIVNNTQNTAGPRAIMFGTGAAGLNNIIEFNKIEGGRSGIGIAGTASTPYDNTTIRNNDIFNWGYAGIWLVSGAANTNIDSNRIYQEVGVNNTIVSGIIMSTISGSVYNIRKNWIYDLRTTATSSSSLRGIYAAAPAAGSIFNISNNMVSNTLDNGVAGQTVTGIEFLGSNAYTLNIHYNTCLIGGNHTGGTAGATTSAAIRINNANVTLNMKNNIAINKRTGGSVNHIAFALLAVPSNLDLNFNCYFAAGTNSFPAWVTTNGYTNISAYKTAIAPQEQNTIFKDVSFNSLTNLHLIPPSDGDAELAGTPIPGITTDFDGQLRDDILPYRGADEATTIPVELVSFTSHLKGNNVELNWTTATETNNYGFEILRKESKSDWQNIAFIKGAGNSVNFNSYSYSDKNLQSGSYLYRLKQIDYSGSYKYYDLPEEIKIGIPEKFELSQNFPNPFNPGTTISWKSPIDSWQKITLFDALGREIETIVDGFYEAGNHSTLYIINPTLPSGVYFYQLRVIDSSTGNIVYKDTKKMILLK